MANLRDGMVLLGVEDDGSIRGTERKNLEQMSHEHLPPEDSFRDPAFL